MLLDLAGQLNSINLAESKALWPLFEAIVNSIQAIEDSPNKDRGRITIMAEREPSMQTGYQCHGRLRKSRITQGYVLHRQKEPLHLS